MDVVNRVQELGGSIVRGRIEKADYIIIDNPDRGMLKAKLMQARTVGRRLYHLLQQPADHHSPG